MCKHTVLTRSYRDMDLYAHLVYTIKNRGEKMPTLRQAPRKKPAHAKPSRLKVERLSMRIDPLSKAKLERAAAYNDESLSDYVVLRALGAAEEDIQTHENVVLPESIWDAFYEALAKPPKANTHLKALLKQHDKLVLSR